MPSLCKDENGDYVDCDSIKGNFKPSDDKSKGTQMKEIYKPLKSNENDPDVYNKLQKEIDSGFAEAKYGYTGNNLNDYIKAKRTEKLYLNPSKNKEQNETLKMQKRGASLLTNTTLGIRDIDIEKIPTTRESTTGEKEYKYTTSSSNKKTTKGKTIKANNNIKDGGLTQCDSDDPTACGLDMAKEIGKEKKAEKKAYNKAQKDRSYRTKKDGTQKLKKKFAPGEYFYQQGWRSGRGLGKNIKTILR